MNAVLRTDVKTPKAINLDKPHEEKIVGVVVLTLSDYSLSVSVKGQIPSVKDIAAVLKQQSDGGEYSKAFAGDTRKN